MTKTTTPISRKQFLRTLAGIGAGAVGASLLIACGSDDDDMQPAGPSCVANGSNITISANHGHAMTVTAADVAAGAEKTYNITGSSPHAHSVTITAAQFAMLAASGTASISAVSTSGDSHTHNVTVTCA
jgi:hypothetical protein